MQRQQLQNKPPASIRRLQASLGSCLAFGKPTACTWLASSKPSKSQEKFCCILLSSSSVFILCKPTEELTKMGRGGELLKKPFYSDSNLFSKKSRLVSKYSLFHVWMNQSMEKNDLAARTYLGLWVCTTCKILIQAGFVVQTRPCSLKILIREAFVGPFNL